MAGMDEFDDQISARIETVLGGRDSAVMLGKLAVALRDEGMTQKEMYRRFAAFLGRHRTDSDETLRDAIADTMDRISGFCSTTSKLFPNYYRGPEDDD
jgi:hypothetical protein